MIKALNIDIYGCTYFRTEVVLLKTICEILCHRFE